MSVVLSSSKDFLKRQEATIIRIGGIHEQQFRHASIHVTTFVAALYVYFVCFTFILVLCLQNI